MESSKCLRALAIAASLVLVGSGVQAQTEKEKGKEKDKKVERHRFVLLDGDGEPRVIEGDGLLVRRGYLGVGLTELTPELRTHFGVPEDAGVMVSHVEKGGPADKAGIKVGDILARLDGKDLESSWDVRAKVRQYKDGEQVPFEVWRGGKAQTINVAIAERERPEVDMAPFFIRRGEEGEPFRLRIPEVRVAPRPGEGPGAHVRPGPGPEPNVRFHRLRTPREIELEKKLEELEKRLNELERQLRKNG